MASTEIYRYLVLNNGQSIPVDPEGYLVDRTHWSLDVARILAKEASIQLDEEHWAVIEVVRDFYRQYEMAPAMRPLVKAVGKQLGAEKGRSIHLMRLFPGSPAKVVARIAGLPKPANCL
ncbi:TusE/DsrC/DsvC family sulfur relay protein [Halomonas sp. 18H]|uniref:TusE/DsrC/DsvC family sulfur relay protein n=1 Tax=Halomonas almeriensis TaxID=308163 RepID=UPI00222F16D0|nr:MULTISPECIES: TusE/DsrC/DsvC family sulfur relay protein [Halomonas]MCW4151897.1 TusE/DsrC/DsvC family sulfur relay protein [Halomonas sp. 18H]MDN3554143.1 TusE/DsrC/DsvC family sulfur relay protein [Halomonas almeriensis]